MNKKAEKLSKKIKDQSMPTPGKESAMQPQPQVIREDYKGSGKLKGKIALISGGDSGIGRSVAVHYAREGADVAIIYLSEDADAHKTKKLVEAEGQKCLLLRGDLGDRTFAENCIKKTVEEFGSLNILVNNAAEQHPADELEELDLDLMEKTFRTNIFSMFYLTKPALEHLQEGDSIINTTSVTAYRGSHHLIDYSATKGAITAFTRSLGTSLASRKIRVNGVAPGPIWTPLIPSTKDNVDEFGKDVPLERPGQPSECGPAYVFLASDDASYMTSQIIHINGGEVVGG
ncbi:SDR family oxidoreductase [Cesiribacter andamanensis]|uniref:General stress protein 39 n=1 Tax=Cesiribacter andamanensis AMV16 TaxID=1279009 RepID=M7NZ98_9BACT|nr:SDR family oxidoreductase [Cesiribacter andamanensis]EMR03679.1 General stress protein 39 [Cesiribacter andamanensis AMV16]